MIVCTLQLYLFISVNVWDGYEEIDFSQLIYEFFVCKLFSGLFWNYGEIIISYNLGSGKFKEVQHINLSFIYYGGNVAF